MKNFRLVAIALSILALAACRPAPSANETPRETLPSIPAIPATTPVSRENLDWWVDLHNRFNGQAKEAAQNGDIDLIFLGDSITYQWSGPGKDVWEEYYATRHAVNFGIGGDRTQHVLWRIEHGNLDGLANPAKGHAPKLLVLMIGTNTSGEDTPEAIADGIRADVAKIREKLPTTKVLLLAIFPRGEHPNEYRERVAKASELVRSIADARMIHYLDIGSQFLEPDASIHKEIMPDFLHLSADGYRLWADAVSPVLHREVDVPPVPAKH